MSYEHLFVAFTLLFYFAGSVCNQLHTFAASERARYVGLGALLLGILAHTAAIGAYCMTGQSVLAGVMPFSIAAYFIAIAQALLSFFPAWSALAALTLPLSFILEFYSWARGGLVQTTGEGRTAMLSHVMLLVCGFAAFTLAFCLAILYLTQSRLLKTKQIRGLFNRLPPLESVSASAHWLAIIGFTMLTLGIITGAIAAPASWGPHWFLDPRTLTSLVAWSIYAAYVAVSSGMGWGGRRTTYFLIAGFLVVLVAFFASVRRTHVPGGSTGLIESRSLA